MLAAGGAKVLLIDLDSQGNLADELGYTGGPVDDDGLALAQALAFGTPVTPRAGVLENLDVLVGGAQLDMAAAGLTMRSNKDARGAKTADADAIAGYVQDYDLVLLDCPFGQETLQQAALAAAWWALISVETDASSRKGLRDVARRLEAVVDINADLDLLGVVLFGVNRAARRVSDTARASITDDLGSPDAVFTTAIRVAEAAAQETCDRGLLAYELEEAVLAAPSGTSGSAAPLPAERPMGARGRAPAAPPASPKTSRPSAKRSSPASPPTKPPRLSPPPPGAPD